MELLKGSFIGLRCDRGWLNAGVQCQRQPGPILAVSAYRGFVGISDGTLPHRRRSHRRASARHAFTLVGHCVWSDEETK
jgi:hypothetical protein